LRLETGRCLRRQEPASLSTGGFVRSGIAEFREARAPPCRPFADAVWLAEARTLAPWLRLALSARSASPTAWTAVAAPRRREASTAPWWFPVRRRRTLVGLCRQSEK